MQFKIKSQITTPVLKLEVGQQFYLYVVGPLFKGKELDGNAAPDVLPVINLEDGRLVDVIPGAVMVQEMQRAYPNASYVGKGFALKKAAIEGKKYRSVDLAEIEVPAEMLPQLAERAAHYKAKQIPSPDSPAAGAAPAITTPATPANKKR